MDGIYLAFGAAGNYIARAEIPHEFQQMAFIRECNVVSAWMK
jgi:hypothetical protein